jgi:hypothetical protein
MRDRVGGAALAASGATGVTAVVTAANRLGALSVTTLAATPREVGERRVWLLFSSGLLADRPAIPSLLGFWIVGFAVLLVCSVRVAVGGHTLSALGVYGAIGLTRLLDTHSFASVVTLTDYGLSAMIAAWLGALACVFWRRHPARISRALIVAGSIGCAGIGLAFRPNVTFLDTEHLLAYGIGVVLADGAIRAWLLRTPRRLGTAAAGLALASPRLLRTGRALSGR